MSPKSRNARPTEEKWGLENKSRKETYSVPREPSPHSCISIWLLLATRRSYFSSPRYNHRNQYRVFIPLLGFKELKAFHLYYAVFTNMRAIQGGSVLWGVGSGAPKLCLHLTDGETEGRDKRGRLGRMADEARVRSVGISTWTAVSAYTLSGTSHGTPGKWPPLTVLTDEARKSMRFVQSHTARNSIDDMQIGLLSFFQCFFPHSISAKVIIHSETQCLFYAPPS